jgi:hypothetical protein
MKITTERVPASGMARILLPAALGWILFFYWWTRVAIESTAAAATIAVAVLAIIALSILFSTLVWIRHNIELAKRGKRGFSTRYLRPIFERDWLDRSLVFREQSSARQGTWFVVHADENQKWYHPQRLIASDVQRAEEPIV